MKKDEKHNIALEIIKLQTNLKEKNILDDIADYNNLIKLTGKKLIFIYNLSVQLQNENSCFKWTFK